MYHNAGFNDIDRHIAAGHSTLAQSWCEQLPVEYMKAQNQNELNLALEKLCNPNVDGNIILEVMTDINIDSDVLTEFLAINHKKSPKEKVIDTLRNIKSRLKRG